MPIEKVDFINEYEVEITDSGSSITVPISNTTYLLSINNIASTVSITSQDPLLYPTITFENTTAYTNEQISVECDNLTIIGNLFTISSQNSFNGLIRIINKKKNISMKNFILNIINSSTSENSGFLLHSTTSCINITITYCLGVLTGYTLLMQKGGLLVGGNNTSEIEIINCGVNSYSGLFIQGACAGGLIGGNNQEDITGISNSKISLINCSINCINSNISCSGVYSGGIIGGSNYDVTITNTNLICDDFGTNTIGVGFIVGGSNTNQIIVSGTNVSISTNTFETWSKYTGGIVGGENRSDSIITLTNCQFISTTSLVFKGESGGLIVGGKNRNNSKITINNCNSYLNNLIFDGSNNSGILGGENRFIKDLIIRDTNVTVTDYLTSSGSSCGCIMGGKNTGITTSVTISSCNVYIFNELNFNSDYNGCIMGGLNDTISGLVTISKCLVILNKDSTLNEKYNGFIVGGRNYMLIKIIETNVININDCNIKNNYNGGILGGGNLGYNSPNYSVTISNCYVDIRGILNLGNKNTNTTSGFFMGGGNVICGGLTVYKIEDTELKICNYFNYEKINGTLLVNVKNKDEINNSKYFYAVGKDNGGKNDIILTNCFINNSCYIPPPPEDILCKCKNGQNFMYGHTYNYSLNKVSNIVEINTDVGNCVSTSAAQTRALKLPQPNSYNNNNKVYRCVVDSWNPSQKAGQQQIKSKKMQQSNKLQYVRKGGRTVYY